MNWDETLFAPFAEADVRNSKYDITREGGLLSSGWSSPAYIRRVNIQSPCLRRLQHNGQVRFSCLIVRGVLDESVCPFIVSVVFVSSCNMVSLVILFTLKVCVFESVVSNILKSNDLSSFLKSNIQKSTKFCTKKTTEWLVVALESWNLMKLLKTESYIFKIRGVQCKSQ